MEDISVLAAFVAGVASFVSPCIIPLVPVYFASLYGPEILDDKKVTGRISAFLHSLSFVVGFSLVFVLMGILVGLTGILISPSSTLIRILSGSLLIAFGIFMLAAYKVPWLNYEKRLTTSLGGAPGYMRSFLTGGIFCLAWTPCVGPLLGSVLTLAWSSQTAWQGAYLLAIYSLGLGLPFLVVGIAFDAITPLLKRIYRYSNVIYIISGVLLIATGVLILTNKLVLFQAVI